MIQMCTARTDERNSDLLQNDSQGGGYGTVRIVRLEGAAGQVAFFRVQFVFRPFPLGAAIAAPFEGLRLYMSLKCCAHTLAPHHSFQIQSTHPGTHLNS